MLWGQYHTNRYTIWENDNTDICLYEENITHKYTDAVVIEMLAVCGALQTQIFEQDANVKRIRITGPGNGANCIITFDIL